MYVRPNCGCFHAVMASWTAETEALCLPHLECPPPGPRRSHGLPCPVPSSLPVRLSRRLGGHRAEKRTEAQHRCLTRPVAHPEVAKRGCLGLSL